LINDADLIELTEAGRRVIENLVATARTWRAEDSRTGVTQRRDDDRGLAQGMEEQ